METSERIALLQEGSEKMVQLTKLETFTMAAMQGYLSNPHITAGTTQEQVAKYSVEMAILTMEALEKAAE